MNHLILWGLGEELKSIGGLTVGLSSLGGHREVTPLNFLTNRFPKI